ncbi:MAG: hypothetical protein NC084_06340 [Bacteroides sp.]|nr:hypothetical protein [Eubacterium sp.]MCM1418157.1 hypothetical protein [Roseburia sp.]MCM1462318.1 hypothetical protein [Bacteroides sp.]
MRIVKCGNTVNILTDLTEDQHDKVLRSRPEALTLKDDDGNEYFKLAVSDSIPTGTLKPFAATLVPGMDGKLCATMVYNGFGGNEEEVNTALTATLLKPTTLLKQIEEQIMAVIPEIEEEEAAFLEMIE